MISELTPAERVDELVTSFFDSRINGSSKTKLLTALRNARNFAEEMERGVHRINEITNNERVFEIEQYWGTIKLTIDQRMKEL